MVILPACIPYVAHYLYSWRGLIPTGFIHADMPQYLAYAREIFEAESFQPVYRNPFSPWLDSPRVYFQVQTLLLGLLWLLTEDSGSAFVIFGVIAVLICGRVALALYAEVGGLDTWPARLGMIAFFWGGGALVLTGAVYSLISRGNLRSMFAFDPFDGWWFLNFGRNLVFPTEAYYHAISFGCALCVLRRRYLAAAGLTLLLTFSHPFTAAEVLSILIVWAALEIHFVENRRVPPIFLLSLLCILALFVCYYVVFLNRFPEHQALSVQLTLPWTYEARHFIPAYLLVGVLALWAGRRLHLAKQLLSLPRNRFFLVWFVVAFGLANHEFAMTPTQPLHFTRGYVWTPLFFLGLAPLQSLFQYLLTRRRRIVGLALSLAVTAFFLLDNTAWLARFPREVAVGDRGEHVLLKPAQKDLLDWLAAHADNRDLLLTRDRRIGYLATVYSAVQSWQSHPHATPGFDARGAELTALFEHGHFLAAWEQFPVLVAFHGAALAHGEPAWLSNRNATRVFANAVFVVYRIPGEHGYRRAARSGISKFA